MEPGPAAPEQPLADLLRREVRPPVLALHAPVDALHPGRPLPQHRREGVRAVGRTVVPDRLTRHPAQPPRGTYHIQKSAPGCANPRVDVLLGVGGHLVPLGQHARDELWVF